MSGGVVGNLKPTWWLAFAPSSSICMFTSLAPPLRWLSGWRTTSCSEATCMEGLEPTRCTDGDALEAFFDSPHPWEVVLRWWWLLVATMAPQQTLHKPSSGSDDDLSRRRSLWWRFGYEDT